MARTTTITRPTRANVDCAPLEFRSLGEYMALVAHSATIDDQRTRNERMGILNRTMSGISGTVGGFGVKPEWADSVFDQARMIDGPYARCQWRTCQARQFEWPIFGGSSRTNGNRWGGMKATWNLSEVSDLSVNAASQPALANVVFAMQPCAIYSGPISKDLLSDTMLIGPALDYAARAEIRYAIEYALINGGTTPTKAGPATLGGPQGVIAAPSTVTVAKGATTSNAISSINISAVWGAIASGNKRNAVWHCNDNTLEAIDELAVSGQWSDSIYLPQGRYGNEVPLIRGRPVLCTEACPEIGNPGDLICVDWTDYWFVIHKPKPTDSGLAFSLTQPPDSGHLGVIGMPADSIEARRSDEFLWTTDSVAFMWRMRADGRFLWPGAVTDAQGNQIGPAAIIAQR
jgi:HK97 family phage major capsid protein